MPDEIIKFVSDTGKYGNTAILEIHSVDKSWWLMRQPEFKI